MLFEITITHMSKNCPRFKSNYFGNGPGFQIRYAVQNSSEAAPPRTFRIGACGGNFTTKAGVLTSPSYPENYTDNADCTYTISQPNGTIINLTVTDMEVNNDQDSSWGYYSYYSYYYNNDDICQTDYLEIRDGGSRDSPLIEYLCGDEIPAPIVSTQSKVWIR